MAEFNFIAQQKVTGWQTTSFEVTAGTREEAEEFIKELLSSGERIEAANEDTIYIFNDEFSYGVTTLVNPHENAGEPTIIIADEKGKELFNNVQVPDKTIDPSSYEVLFAKIMDENMFNPFFLAIAFDTYTQKVNQLSDEELLKEYGFLFGIKFIRHRISTIHKLLISQDIITDKQPKPQTP